MCGIAGYSGAFDPSLLARMNAAIAHRGPDDAGTAVFPEAGVGLAHRRLSIIDLSPRGHQPMTDVTGTVAIVYNGEIYNYKELRSGLIARGHRFATHSDTEVIVHLYEEVGSRLVERLRGMFAFAVWDARRRRLLLARDHLGQKPMFWARSGGRFLFGSEIKATLAVAPELARLDPEGLHEYLSLRVI